MKSINVEAGFCFCGGWNFSKSVIVDSTFIREMRVRLMYHYRMGPEKSQAFWRVTRESVDTQYIVD